MRSVIAETLVACQSSLSCPSLIMAKKKNAKKHSGLSRFLPHMQQAYLFMYEEGERLLFLVS